MNVTCENFSDLPMDLVIKIITFLSFVDAFRLCLLRREWHFNHLWQHCSSFELDEVDFMFIAVRQYLLNMGRKIRSMELKRCGKIKFVDFFNRTVPLLVSPVLTRFSFRMSYAMQYKDNIDNWISFALSKRVEELNLDFSDADPLATQTCSSSFHELQYVLPNFFFQNASSVRALSLTFCRLRYYNFTGFSRLTTLSLIRVDIKRTEIMHILNTCPVLETLILVECGELNKVEICHPFLKLKRLIVRHCYPLFMGVELYVPGLLSFEYAGNLVWFTFRQMTNLQEIMLDLPRDNIYPFISEEVRSLLAGMANVRVLCICTTAVKVLPEEYLSGQLQFVLPHLEHLTLRTRLDEHDIPGILCLLQNSPHLKFLHLLLYSPRLAQSQSYDDAELPDALWMPRERILEELEVVEVHGFTGKQYELEVLKFILRTSKSLHLLNLKPIISCNAVPFLEQIAELLKGEIASECLIIKWE